MKTFKISIVLIFVVLIISACGEDGDMPFVPMDDPEPVVQEDLSVVDNRVMTFMDQYNIPGASIAVSKNERMVYAKGYGMADTSIYELVSPKSVFRVASISKMFTGVSILKLVEDGELNLDDKVFGPTGILGTNFGTATLSKRRCQFLGIRLTRRPFFGWFWPHARRRPG